MPICRLTHSGNTRAGPNFPASTTGDNNSSVVTARFFLDPSSRLLSISRAYPYTNSGFAIFSDDAEIFRRLEHGRTLLGSGWKWVESFEDINDDAYEEEEEEEYLLMDLGTSVDTRTLQTEAAYQLIGLDTPMPFLKIGENVFEGRVAPLIGDEVIFDVVRQEDGPGSQRPTYRPAYKTRQRIEFRGITLHPRGTSEREPQPPPKIPGRLDRGMFPTRRRRIDVEGEEKNEDDDDEFVEGGKAKAKSKSRSPEKGKGKEKEVEKAGTPVRRSGRSRGGPAPTLDELTAMATPGPSVILTTGGVAPEEATPAGEAETPADATPAESPAPSGVGTPTPARGGRRGGPGRPKGGTNSTSTPRMVRTAVAVASLSDLADIAFAGGLGDGHVRLDVAPNADAELLAAVAEVRRGKPWVPGTRLTPAQEERLLRNLPATGPGSRGGRGRGRGRSTRGSRRGHVDVSGEGLGDAFFGIGEGAEGDDAGLQGMDEDGDDNKEDDEAKEDMDVDEPGT